MAKRKDADKPAPKRGRGRPSKFNDAIYEQVTNYCLLGATNDKLAELLGVGATTIDRWIREKPEFRGAIQKGRDEADATVAKSLYHRACGYSHPKVHVSNYQGQITLTPLTEHYPPDTAAAFIWLKNRQPARWRDKAPEGSDMSPEQAARDVQEAIARAQATTDGPAAE
jgi:hypothetical protein